MPEQNDADVLADDALRAAERTEPGGVHGRRRRGRQSTTTARSRILQLPSDARRSPARARSPTNSTPTPTIQNKLLPFKQAGAQVDLRQPADPAGRRRAALRPAGLHLARRRLEGTYPVLQLVLVSFGDKVGSGSTLDEALSVVLGSSSGGTITPPPPDNGNGNGTSDTVRSLLEQADAKYTEAQTRSGRRRPPGLRECDQRVPRSAPAGARARPEPHRPPRQAGRRRPRLRRLDHAHFDRAFEPPATTPPPPTPSG